MTRLIGLVVVAVLGLALAACSSSSTGVGGNQGGSGGSPSPTASGFTANCFITGEVTGNPGYAEVTLNNPTSQDESIDGNQVNVIFYNQQGGEIGTGTVNTVSVIAAEQTVTTAPNAISGDAPTGSTSCSVGPYQINP